MKLENIEMKKIIQVLDKNIQEPYKRYDIFYVSNWDCLCIDENGNKVELDPSLEVKELNVDYDAHFQIFGSISSTDWDIMVFVNDIPENEFDATAICKGYNIILPITQPYIFELKKPMNCNLAVIDCSTIKEVYKGTVDECNNSLMDTYILHENGMVNIRARMERDVQIKALRTARVLLSFLSRTEYRPQIKKALRGDLNEKLEVLKEIDFSTITELGKRNIDFKDYVKTMAFQLGQTNCLMANGVELYTKESIFGVYHFLKPHLMREDNPDLSMLELMKLSYIEECERFEFDTLIEYDYKKIQ